MKTTFSLVLALSCLTSILASVTVQDGNYTFPLEDVKQLWALMGTLDENNAAAAGSASTKLCPSSALPKTFQSVCASKDADQVFLRLEEIAQKVDVCEICAYAACTGCESVNLEEVP
ncbi:guanylin-like [Hemitrygon akajei]|uniref:guanylin-like n=1 Tax=Hemitrygon akajei TaxID=2704970 RepID=UPI003BFA020E